MKVLRDLLSLALLASGLLGTQILATDQWLWTAAPSHAYGLLVFMIIDLALAALAMTRMGLASVAAGIISMAQFGAMLADIVSGQPSGVAAFAFRSYLLSDSSYIGLLIIQIVILILATGTLARPFVQHHPRLATLLHLHRN